MPACLIIIVEVYTGDHFVINLGFWKTSEEQEERVMEEIKQIHHLNPTKVDFKYVRCIFYSTCCLLVVILTFVRDVG